MSEGERSREGAHVLPRYERLLASPHGAASRARREASAAARMCLEAMRFRFAEPDALFVVDLLIRLGDVGAFDLEGSLRKIGGQIGELLDEQPDPTRLYRGMRALAGRTCLVERVSRQIWRLGLAGLTDPSSTRHRRLLTETPSPFRLTKVNEADEVPPQVVGHDAVVQQQRLEAAETLARNTVAELDSARAELRELSGRLEGLGAELTRSGDQVEMMRRERDVAVDRLQSQADSFSTERRQLEDLLLDREIAIEELGRQLTAIRAEQPAPAVPAIDLDKLTALRATLKAERERRRAAENRLRQVLSALRIKLEAENVLKPADIEFDRVLWDSLAEALVEHLDVLDAEQGVAGPEPVPGMDMRDDRKADAELAGALIELIPGTGSRSGRSRKPS
jgi:hypothetical protein